MSRVALIGGVETEGLDDGDMLDSSQKELGLHHDQDSIPLMHRSLDDASDTADKRNSPSSRERSSHDSHHSSRPHHHHHHHGHSHKSAGTSGHHPSSQKTDTTSRRLAIGIAICFIFFLIELAGGLYANSLALIADSFHLLTDSAAYIVAYAAIWISKKAPTARFTYGYKRAEVIGALVSVLMIWVVVYELLREAIERIRGDPEEIDAKTMLPLSILGLIVNISMLFVLGLHNHGGHSHSHSSCTSAKGAQSQASACEDGHAHAHGQDKHHDHDHGNLNLRAAVLHVIGDMLCSIGVVLSSIIILANPKWTILDPICTLIFSVLTLFTTYKIMKDIFFVLMEAAPKYTSHSLQVALLQLPSVISVHGIRVWSVTQDFNVCRAHIVVSDDADAGNRDSTIRAAAEIARTELGLSEWTFQVESEIEASYCQEHGSSASDNF
ncbi:cation efflux family-domain-containing protein [Phlyctochytrium arcticum]|nr:cation efflux family-domain-containing protein [Phlyctochytrium arcticum]